MEYRITTRVGDSEQEEFYEGTAEEIMELMGFINYLEEGE